jgi:anti-anti-sigma factor
MDITTRSVDQVKIVDFNGNLDTNTAPQAESLLKDLVDGGDKKILINLLKLDYISSAGLRVFLATAKQLKAEGGEMRLCNLNETVQEIFDISGFSMIFTVKPNEEEALKGF